MQSKTILALACLLATHTLTRAQDKPHSSETDILTIYQGAHSYKEVSVAGKTTEVYLDDKRVADNEVQRYDSLIQVMRTGSDRFAREDGDRSEVIRDQEHAERDRERDQELAERDRERGDRDREQGEMDRAQGKWDRVQAKFNRMDAKADREQAKHERAMLRSLIQSLVDKNIVSDKQQLDSLILTDTALYVNGVRQPNEIHQALKEQYADWAHKGLSYGESQAPGTTVFFSKPSCDCY